MRALVPDTSPPPPHTHTPFLTFLKSNPSRLISHIKQHFRELAPFHHSSAIGPWTTLRHFFTEFQRDRTLGRVASHFPLLLQWLIQETGAWHLGIPVIYFSENNYVRGTPWCHPLTNKKVGGNSVILVWIYLLFIACFIQNLQSHLR